MPLAGRVVGLLVVMDTPLRETQPALEIRQYLNPLFGLDIPVSSPARVEERFAWGDSFLRDVIERGTVLYDVNRELCQVGLQPASALLRTRFERG